MLVERRRATATTVFVGLLPACAAGARRVVCVGVGLLVGLLVGVKRDKRCSCARIMYVQYGVPRDGVLVLAVKATTVMGGLHGSSRKSRTDCLTRHKRAFLHEKGIALPLSRAPRSCRTDDHERGCSLSVLRVPLEWTIGKARKGKAADPCEYPTAFTIYLQAACGR